MLGLVQKQTTSFVSFSVGPPRSGGRPQFSADCWRLTTCLQRPVLYGRYYSAYNSAYISAIISAIIAPI